MQITVSGGKLSEKEIKAYEQYCLDKYKDKTVTALHIEIDGDYVNLSVSFAPVPFDRIRRITGYLVGTLDRFNDAKRAEERDRVKHGITR